MVDYKYRDLFWKSHVDKQLKIETDDGLFVATNEDINWENFELTESLCSESELVLGSCEASMVKFQIRNAFIPLAGKWITITETLDGNVDEPFQYGRYKVFSDKPTADREYRDIVAYDKMYDVLNADMTEWYNIILINEKSEMTMKEFRELFAAHFGLPESTPKGGLINDNAIVKRTIEPEQLSGKDVITAICEINGCFGHIGRDGKFHYIYLQQDIQGLYPANFLFPDHVPEKWDYLSQAKTGHLYPQSPKGTSMSGKYISGQYEDYVVRTIDKLQIRQEENDIGTIYGEGSNCYIIEDNFLAYGKSANDLNEIAKKIYDKLQGVMYRPFNAECVGNPCLEVGDSIRFSTKYEIVESYILNRTLKGIQGLRDSFSTNGQEYRSEKINSVQKSIIQLRGKTNVLTRTVDETKSEIKDVESGLTSTITQTAGEIRTEIKDTKEGLESSITQTAEEIKSTVSESTSQYDTSAYDVSLFGYDSPPNIPYKAEEYFNQYYLNQKNGKLYKSNGFVWAFIEELRLITTELSSQIKQTSDEIAQEVIARTKEGETIKASLELKIDNDDDGTIVSLINGSADKIHFGAKNMFTVESPNFNVDEAGNAEFSGLVMSDNGKFFAKIDNATLQGGVSGKKTTGYVAFNSKYTSTGIDGIRVAGEGIIALYTPYLGVGDWTELGKDGIVQVGQSATQKIITDITDNGDGTISWEWKEIEFTKGLMTTAL